MKARRPKTFSSFLLARRTPATCKILFGAFDDRVYPSRGGHLEVRLERGHLVRWSAVSPESGGDAVGASTRVRLERLGFFKEVKTENVPVPGTDDMIDVDYTVEEQSSGSIGSPRR